LADLETTSRRYERLSRIAAGGMATVYLGRLRGAEGFRRLVAIKRPHKFVLSDPEMREAFLREAHLAAAIHHPNVVSVLDVDDSDNQLSLVLEYVDGVALSTLTSEGKLPLAIALQIILDAARGLHAAHSIRGDDGNPLNLVHRDVTPHNILVALDGVAKLTDFGIARASERQGVTRSDVLKGKASYMAPEYVKKRHLDARSDIFGLGVVAWETLTGERLFVSEQILDTLRRVVSEDIPPPSTVSKDVPSALDAVLARALARDPAQRYQTAKEFATALSGAMTSLGLHTSMEEIGALVQERAGDELEARKNALAASGEVLAPSLGRAADEATGPLPDAPPPSKPPAQAAASTRAISHPRAGPDAPVLAAPPASVPPPPASIPPAALASIPPAAPRKPRKLFALIAVSAVTAGLSASWLLYRAGRDAGRIPANPSAAPATAAPSAPPVQSIAPIVEPAPPASAAPAPPTDAPKPPTVAAKIRPRGFPAPRPKPSASKIDKAAPNPY
jgi:serine/threonine-protein kinase